MGNDLKKRGASGTVLVVDDSPAIRKLLAAAFLSSGFNTCVQAENGKEGIAVAKEAKPDLITLDLSMPVMNGLQSASELRKIFPDTPIILFTLYGDQLPQTEVSRVGINLVLPKAAPISTLLSKAHELLGGKFRTAFRS